MEFEVARECDAVCLQGVPRSSSQWPTGLQWQHQSRTTSRSSKHIAGYKQTDRTHNLCANRSFPQLGQVFRLPAFVNLWVSMPARVCWNRFPLSILLIALDMARGFIGFRRRFFTHLVPFPT